MKIIGVDNMSPEQVLGWWGIPWGPIWTISTIVTNLRGGRDVTNDVVRSMTTPVAGVTRR